MGDIFNGSIGIIEIAALALLPILLLLILYLKQKSRTKALLESETMLKGLINTLDVSKGLEDNLLDLLAIFGSHVYGRDYVFYIFDKKNNNYVLKSIMNTDNTAGRIEPSYSGLLPYKKEKYIPPLSLAYETNPKEAAIINDGHVPVLVVPIKGSLGMVRISPVSDIPSKVFKDLNLLSERMQPVLNTLVEADSLKNQAKSALSAGKAVHNISNIFTDLGGTLGIIMGISMRAIGASGGLFIKEEDGTSTVETVCGLEGEEEKLLKNDRNLPNIFSRLVGDNQYYIFKKGDNDYLNLPPYMLSIGAEVILLIGVPVEKGRCIAAFWGRSDTEIYYAREYQITAALIMAKRMGDILNNHLKFREYSQSYVKMLRFLANMVDNLSPYTVGYSELMSRYCSIIAREMKLEPGTVKDISLAAYLSNIGILGLSDDLFHKKGKYTDFEYEMMKLHTEVGASIIEATITNRRVADYIRYHHERTDGNGYMAGLKGDEIPLGARIIAVVQTFLAKIMGREYRTPLPFKEALNLIKTASGSQLDENVVNVLVNWFEKKERECLKRKCSLGNCWEMRCCPESSAAGCPVYMNTGINCWEAPANNCRTHGNSCSTCYIYTEYLYRMDQRI